MRAALYSRVSTDTQADADRNSLPVQQQAFERRCAERGYEVGESFVDVESGRRTDRPAYQRMLTAARAREFDVLVVTFLDRFGRDQWEVMRSLGELRALGVEVEAIHEDLGEFVMVALSAWKADQESKRIGERVKMTSANAVRNGKPLGAIPYGYRRFRNESSWGVVVNEDQSAVVREIFRLYLDENLSMAQIRSRLNDQAIPAPRGKTWSAESVFYVLSRRTYYGDFTYGETTVEGMVPAIIDRETFEAAERRRRAKVELRAPRAHRSDYLLSGIIYCGHCGGRMEGNTTSPRGKGPYRRYTCATYRKRQTCSYRNQHDADRLEQAVVRELAERFGQPMDLSRDDPRARMRAELDTVEKRLAAIPDRLIRNMALFESGAIASEAQLGLVNRTLDIEQQTLTTQRERLIESMEHAEDELSRRRRHEAIAYTFAAEFERMTVQQKKAVLQEVVERVEVRSGNPDPLIVLREVAQHSQR